MIITYISATDLRYRVGIKGCHQIVNTKTFKEIGASFVDMAVPECKAFAEGSREYWKCFLHYRFFPNPHTSGTCRMGSKEDSTAVVDTELRCYSEGQLYRYLLIFTFKSNILYATILQSSWSPRFESGRRLGHAVHNKCKYKRSCYDDC